MSAIAFWVVYERPNDYPDKFVTRKFLNDCPTDEFFVADSLSDLKTKVPANCVFLPPSVEDDPKIVGVWMEGV